jgi:hypothetical protein
MIVICVCAILILILLFSLILAITSADRQNAIFENNPWLIAVGAVAVFFGFAIMLGYFGMIGRGEASILPWVAYRQEALQHGVFSGVFSCLVIVFYDLWAFWIPGHLFANHVKQKYGRRPAYPYIVNILMGILMAIENGPIYRLVMWLIR